MISDDYWMTIAIVLNHTVSIIVKENIMAKLVRCISLLTYTSPDWRGHQRCSLLSIFNALFKVSGALQSQL